MINLAVLISGNGSNLQAIIDYFAVNNELVKVALVISNKSDAYGLERAKKAGISTLVLNHKLFPDRKQYDEALHHSLTDRQIDLIALAGFMRILSPEFVQKWQSRLLNIHPSLLPKYKGMNAIEQAYKAKEKEIGCTVHYVNEGVDEGEIILNMKTSILDEDNFETITKKVHELEHQLYPKIINEIARKLK